MFCIRIFQLRKANTECRVSEVVEEEEVGKVSAFWGRLVINGFYELRFETFFLSFFKLVSCVFFLCVPRLKPHFYFKAINGLTDERYFRVNAFNIPKFINFYSQRQA